MLYNTHIKESQNVDSVFCVPVDCFKPNDSVLSSIDFKRMLKVIHFWGVSTLSVDMITYCDFYSYKEWIRLLEDRGNNKSNNSSFVCSSVLYFIMILFLFLYLFASF